MQKNTFPLTCIDTKETVYSYNEYLKTEHWRLLKKKYWLSGLSKFCQRCGKNDNPYDFHHRTYKRIGKEYLMDIIPLCRECHYRSHVILNSPHGTRVNIWNAHKKGKKKVVRQQLKPFSFNPNRMPEADREWLISIKPHMRGCILYNYFSDKVTGYHVGHQWVSQQVSNACRWIRKETRSRYEKIISEI